jgi:Lipocalin-like domain
VAELFIITALKKYLMKIFFLYALIILQSCNSLQNNANRESQLSGSWKVVADQLLDDNYNVIDQDTTVTGLILYMPDGKMSAQILWKDIRSPMLNDTIMNQDGKPAPVLGIGKNTWTTEQARKLIDSYDSYFGDYSIDKETNIVTHIMTGNLRPEKEGTVYRRIFKIKGDSLFLQSADPLLRWRVACVRNKK